MKTLALTTAILLATVIGINKSAYASTINHDQVSTTLTVASHISKIELHGNVELYVSDGAADQVKVYNQYYKESALVQDQNGTLNITSYKAEKLVVWVTASDLRSLVVYDNAEVKTFGKLSVIDLDVKLYNNASAQLTMDAYQANITLNDHAKADVAGNINQGEIKYNKASYLNTTGLVADNIVKTVSLDHLNKDEASDFVSL